MRPVVAFDIDGTFGGYHEHFLAFAEGYLGRAIPRKYDGSVPLHKWCGTSKVRYREMKRAYRMGGQKRSMPTLGVPYPDASYTTRLARQWGADVWLCTTRPYLAHDNIDADTREWCRRNGVVYQGIIWGEHKYRELARTVGRERVAMVLEDDVAMCLQARKLGMPTVWAVRPHNEREAEGMFAPTDLNGGWCDVTATDSEETVHWMREYLATWKEYHQ